MAEPIPRKLVKDAQWGSVPLLVWERHILAHPIFARLHNVLQNSTAFRVYPSLRTSRYVHSIGVMHVATEMFRAAVIESKPEFVALEGLKTHAKLSAIKTLVDEAQILVPMIGAEERKMVVEHVRAIFPVRSPDGVPADEALHVALAALRLAALLHDLGHLPASHIFEFAIEDAATKQWAAREAGAQLDPNDATVMFLDWIAKFPGGKFHEEVGRLLLGFLGEEFEKKTATMPLQLGGTMKAASHILHAVPGDTPTLCLRSFVSSLLDADRIDFVRRDTETSGLLQSAVDYGRLLRFMELRPVNLDSGDEEKIPHLIVMPGKRAHSDIEKVLMERFLDYRYIAAHHRVHLGDELLARCIGVLLRVGRLNPIIETLLRLSSPDTGGETDIFGQDVDKLKVRLYLCTKFDDAWLETTLRDLWIESVEKKSDVSLEPKERLLLNAHILNGSTVESAFQSEEDFQSYVAQRPDAVCLKWYREIQADFATAATVTKARDSLQHAATCVKDSKLQWESDLFSEFSGKLILVGDLVSNLRTGFPPASRMISDRMDDLVPASEFLNAKLRDALVLNVWFDRKLAPQREAILDSVCAKMNTAYYARLAMEATS